MCLNKTYNEARIRKNL